MSQEKVLKTLENLGLAQPEAQIYVFLGKKGSQRARDIAKSLRVPRQTLYRAIKNLQSKGIITATITRPAKFSAVPFERVLDLFVKAKAEEVHRIEQDKNSLLTDWQSIAITEVADQSPKFSVIEGRNFIYPRLKQMIEETKSQLSIILTLSGLMRAMEFGLLDAAFNHASKTNTKFRFLTESTSENLNALKRLLEKIPKEVSFEGRTPELGLRPISRILIRDDAEAAFFISQESDRSARGPDDLCLWTNSNAIVDSFKAVFEDLWHNSIDIKKRIAEIETGKPTPKTYVISDPAAAKKKYYDVIRAATTDVVMMTSSNGLVEVWKNKSLLKELAQKGVSFIIMAPITRHSLEAALQLSDCCKVRHVPASYLGTTIVDGNHFFQFKNPRSDEERHDEPLSFENTFYSNDPEYLIRARSMLDEVWKNACAPSAITLEEIIKPPTPIATHVADDEYSVSRKDSPYQKMLLGLESKPGAMTEQDVLNRIINAKRVPPKDLLRDVARFYGSEASAIIHSPANFNLPDMMLVIFHCNKHSSFGAEDSMIVYLWLETPKGHAYVPVAVVDDNPKGVEWRKMSYAGTPAGQNCRILRKDQLQVQLHGTTLFSGWTVPIPLFPPQYTLPPASLLIEGYGKLKTTVTKYTLPSGTTSIMEGNGFDAFATFFHPASKYAGPGTDAILGRDLILTVYPPFAKKNVEGH